jgi:hypothetical protein
MEFLVFLRNWFPIPTYFFIWKWNILAFMETFLDNILLLFFFSWSRDDILNEIVLAFEELNRT